MAMKSPKLPEIHLPRRLRSLYIVVVSLAAGGLLCLSATSVSFQLHIPLRQLHVAWNLTRILIEF